MRAYLNDINLYESYDKLTATEDKGFSMSATDTVARLTPTDKVAYGSIKNQDAPVIEGYSHKTVAQTEDASHPSIADGNHIWKVQTEPSLSGTMAVGMSYEPTSKTLTADANTRSHWTLAYTDSATGNPAAPTTMNDNSATVKYHSSVTVTPQAGTQHAEFITVAWGSDSFRLNDGDTRIAFDNATGVYSFTMPDAAVTLSYSDVETLYLDNGSIEITDSGYTQYVKTAVDDGEGGTTIIMTRVDKIWHGGYVIKQNDTNTVASTAPATNENYANKLSLSGNLSDRSITLGNVKISGTDSIAMVPGTTATLMLGSASLSASFDAMNILVPETSSLTMGSGTGSKVNVNLAPSYDASSQRAAIGGSTASPVNGTIKLADLNLDLTMNVKSAASGIEPGAYNAGGSNTITLTDCAVNVTENNAGGDGDTWTGGAWLGGKNVSSLTLTNCSVNRKDSSAMIGLRTADGTAVTLNNSTIGSSSSMVGNPVLARATLTVNGSDLYMENNRNLGSHTMIGDTGCTTVVQVNSTDASDNSTIAVSYTNSGASYELFYGTMKLMDVNQNVTINNVRVLDVSHRDITVDSGSYTQSTRDSVAHSGNYMLLDELTHGTGYSAHTLNVNAVKTLAVKDPVTTVNAAVTLASVTLSADTEFVLDGDLTVNGMTSLGTNELTVTAADDSLYTATLNGGFDSGNTGSYSQTNGQLARTSAGDLAVGGNMTLNGVTATLSDGKIGSTGAGASSTTVSLMNSTVTATTIGALGALSMVQADGTTLQTDSTYTTVAQRGTNTFTGTLVQDHYRIVYDKSGVELDLTGWPAALRTSTVYTSGTAGSADIVGIESTPDGVPATPTVGAGVNSFGCWYVYSADGATRYAVYPNSISPSNLPLDLTLHALPVDLSASPILPYDVDSCTGIRTLTVYAYLTTSDITIKNLMNGSTSTGDTITYTISGLTGTSYTYTKGEESGTLTVTGGEINFTMLKDQNITIHTLPTYEELKLKVVHGEYATWLLPDVYVTLTDGSSTGSLIERNLIIIGDAELEVSNYRSAGRGKAIGGQVFSDFTGVTNPQVSRDSTYTVQFSVSDIWRYKTEPDQYDYSDPALSFDHALPDSTRIIMKVGDNYYKYICSNLSANTAILLSSFTELGGSGGYPYADGSSFTALFMVDFSRCSSYPDATDPEHSLTTTLTYTSNALHPEHMDIPATLTASAAVELVNTASFSLSTSDSGDSDLVVPLSVGYTPSGGTASIWTGREMALVVEPQTTLPADAKLSMFDTEYPRISGGTNGRYIIPLGNLGNSTPTLELKSSMFLAAGASYTMKAKL